ncbi:MAG: hypothetical protein HOE53_03680 [Candidatus Magasanikbacteria bacterium]|nr:hypothetical protein [Candidatus Magasanikbacteria bacterium]
MRRFALMIVTLLSMLPTGASSQIHKDNPALNAAKVASKQAKPELTPTAKELVSKGMWPEGSTPWAGYFYMATGARIFPGDANGRIFEWSFLKVDETFESSLSFHGLFRTPRVQLKEADVATHWFVTIQSENGCAWRFTFQRSSNTPAGYTNVTIPDGRTLEVVRYEQMTGTETFQKFCPSGTGR